MGDDSTATCEIKEEEVEGPEGEDSTPTYVDDSHGEPSGNDHSGLPNGVEEMVIIPDCVQNDTSESAAENPFNRSVESRVEGSTVPENDVTSASDIVRSFQVKRKRRWRKETMLTCEFCPYSCPRTCDMKRHIRSHTGEKPFACHVCDYATTRSSHLKLHMRIHTGEKPYKCDLCEYATGDPSHLNAHKRTHSEAKPFHCEICGGAFKRARDLHVHIQRIHLGIKANYTCEFCEFTCRGAETLRTHIERFHVDLDAVPLEPLVELIKQEPTDEEENLGNKYEGIPTVSGETPGNENDGPCLSEEVANENRTIERAGDGDSPAVRTDSDVPLAPSKRRKKAPIPAEKYIFCEVCSYMCTRPGDLKIHMRTHTGEKPYKCDVCNYSSTRAGHLKLHMRIHTGEKPYKCDVCDYASSDNGHLKAHKKTHSEERPHQCVVCGSAFKRTHDLTVHARIHTGERPHACNFCDYASNRPSHLKNHMKRHHSDTEWQLYPTPVISNSQQALSEQALLEPELQISVDSNSNQGSD